MQGSICFPKLVLLLCYILIVLVTSQEITSEWETYDTALSRLSPASSIREYRKALVSMETLAKSGRTRASADAMAVLSQIYIFGCHGKKIVTQQQPLKSFYYANQSSNAGSPKGHNMLAFLYRYGLGTEQDLAKAKELEMLAAELNYLPSMMVVAYESFEDDRVCERGLRTYRLAAAVAGGKVDASFLGDYASLQPLSREADELGDDVAERHARQLETVEYWQFLAARKDPRGLYELGRIHHLGLHGRPRNLELAVELYGKAGALESVEAMAALGRLQSIGHGCELNMGEALRKLRLGATNYVKSNDNETDTASGGGTGEAEATLGVLLQRQVFTSEDSRMGLRYLHRGAALGNADAMFELGEAAARDGHVDEANQYFADAVKRGHVRSARALARHYEAGVGVPESCKMAAAHYKFACDVGPWLDEPFGPRHVVRAYWEGRTTDALFLALYTADQGYAVSQFNAAWMLLCGKGTKELERHSKGHKPRKLAADLLLRVIAQSDRAVDSPGVHVSASSLLGDLLSAGGEGPPAKNDSLAVASYSRAAEEGDPDAMEKLAIMLSRGKGVPQRDFERAEELLVACSKTVQRERAAGFRLRVWALGYRLMWLQLSSVLFQLKEVLFPSKFLSYQPTQDGGALMPHEPGEGLPGFAMEFSLWGDGEEMEGEEVTVEDSKGGEAGSILHKARRTFEKPLKDAQRRLSRTWGLARQPSSKGSMSHPHQAPHLKHMQGGMPRQTQSHHDSKSCTSEDAVWFSPGELFMLALEQPSSEEPSATARCLRVDGSVGACDLSAIYAAVPQEADSSRCRYLLPSPFVTRQRTSETGEEVASLRKATRRSSSEGSQAKSASAVHAIELPFGGFTLTGDLSFVPTHMHGILGIRSANAEGGGAVSLVEEEDGDSLSQDHDHEHMCCLARTYCGEHTGLELSAQVAWHCGEEANLWHMRRSTRAQGQGAGGSVEVVASPSGKCIVIAEHRAMLQSSHQSFRGESCQVIRIISMGVRSPAIPNAAPPTPMLAEDGKATTTWSPEVGITRPSEAKYKGREGVMLEISADGYCIQRRGGNNPVAVACDAAVPGQRWRVRVEYDRLVHGFNAFQLVQEGQEGCLGVRASQETGRREHMVHFSSCQDNDLYSWWVISDHSGTSNLQNLGLVKAGESSSSCLGVGSSTLEKSAEGRPLSLVKCRTAVFSVRA